MPCVLPVLRYDTTLHPLGVSPLFVNRIAHLCLTDTENSRLVQHLLQKGDYVGEKLRQNLDSSYPALSAFQCNIQLWRTGFSRTERSFQYWNFSNKNRWDLLSMEAFKLIFDKCRTFELTRIDASVSIVWRCKVHGSLSLLNNLAREEWSKVPLGEPHQWFGVTGGKLEASINKWSSSSNWNTVQKKKSQSNHAECTSDRESFLPGDCVSVFEGTACRNGLQIFHLLGKFSF